VKTQLQRILDHASALPVVVASQGERFEIGTVYIGEPSEHLTLAAESFGVLISDPAASMATALWTFSSSR
jgi:chemotaxis response regulator CheB